MADRFHSGNDFRSPINTESQSHGTYPSNTIDGAEFSYSVDSENEHHRTYPLANQEGADFNNSIDPENWTDRNLPPDTQPHVVYPVADQAGADINYPTNTENQPHRTYHPEYHDESESNYPIDHENQPHRTYPPEYQDDSDSNYPIDYENQPHISYPSTNQDVAGSNNPVNHESQPHRTHPPEYQHGSDFNYPESNLHRNPPIENQVSPDFNYPENHLNRTHPHDISHSYHRSFHTPRLHVDDSFHSVLVIEGEERGVDVGGGPGGVANEGYDYDGDVETDQSYQANPLDPPVLRQPDPFPVLERPLSGRYQKNPSMEKKQTVPMGPGLYDPSIGVYLSPPVNTRKPNEGSGGGRKRVRKRIPRPPTSLQMKCAFFWSCLACMIGSFLCAIPALRYAVTANESRKIGDVNSANSYWRKTIILALVALAVGVGGWAVLILYLSDSL